MKLLLVDPIDSLCEEWRKAFLDFPEVKIHNTTFENIKNYDYLVSPANSYGLMDGGVDRVITAYFGRNLQKKVQKIIKEEYFGEQPVGTSIIVSTGHRDHPYLAHTPTMRVPSDIRGTTNVYTAMSAMLRTIKLHKSRKGGKTILCMGLGTLTGKMSFESAAYQMQLAYRNFKSPQKTFDWQSALQRESNILNKVH